MCLAKVVVTKQSHPDIEVRDVVHIVRTAAGVAISTLFGEELSFPGMGIAQVDMQTSVILLVEEQKS